MVAPTLQCKEANSLQQQAFDYYVKQEQHGNGNSFSTAEWASSDNKLVYSAFVPAFYHQPTVWGRGPPSNFNATLGPSYDRLEKENSLGLQLWLLLYDQSLVCSAVNASYDLSLEFFNNTQNITGRRIEVLGQIGDTDYSTWINYVGVLHALFEMLTGNVTVSSNGMFVVKSSSIVSSGLVACGELSKSGLFPSEEWMCRNRSIARGIEDLANNVTIGVLSIHAITTSETVLVTTPTAIIRYNYHSRNLILSYRLAISLSALSVLAGGRAFRSNGVTHRFSFSAIMTTTCSPDFNSLCEGESLGALPLSQDLKQTKLRFGLLENLQDEVDPDKACRAGFGLEHRVNYLATGAKCI